MAEPPKRKAMDFAAVRDWPGYFQTVLGKSPRETLVNALERLEKEGRAPGEAVDLACGEGRDTLELLKRGWRVTAIEPHPMGFELLQPRVPETFRGRLTVQVADFKSAAWGPVDLVNCSFALPFCEPDQFPDLWDRIVKSIRPGGRFSGQLFGDRDSWARLADRTHHARSELDGLFSQFVLEFLNEEEKDDREFDGKPKHWHVFHIVARKR
jgi:SAM-dependent methyltransferase